MASKDTMSIVDEPTTDGGTIKSGETLQGRYLITKAIGVGGMGSVYQSRDMHFPNVTKYVAVKEMINFASDPAMRDIIIRNFEREADMLATLNHPAIPKIYDYFSSEQRSYLVMEYIDGRDLEDILDAAEGFIATTQVVEWGIELCDVLAYLHRQEPQSIIFRDMKPSNVMIDHHQHVRLVDFGIARDFRTGQRGTMIGTEGYSPPEQYRGEASPQADIYALGATLHHLLSKKDPRLEAPFSFGERPLGKINSDVSEEIIATINTSLAYDPQDRFPDAGTMRNALGAVKMGQSIPIDTQTGTVIYTELVNVPEVAGPAGGIAPVWTFECEDEIRTTPLVAGNQVFISVYDHNIYALNAADGSFEWKFAAEAGFAASPIHVDGQLFIGSEDEHLYALNAADGRELWKITLGAPIRSTANHAAGHIFVGSDRGFLHAVNAQSAQEAWNFDAGAEVRSRPAIEPSGEGWVYFGTESGEFYCIDFRGNQKWRFRAKRAITASPAMHEGVVVFASMDWTVYASEADTSFALWRFRSRRAFVSSPAIDPDGKRVYIGSADGSLYALNLRNGKQSWAFETEDQIASSPAVHEGRIYFGSVDGHLYCINSSDGELIWKYQTDGPVISSPTVAGDLIYVGSADNRLYAFKA